MMIRTMYRTVAVFAFLFLIVGAVPAFAQNIYTVAGSGPAAAGTNLLFAEFADFDSNGNMYVADSQAHVVYQITPSGTVSIFAGTENPGTATEGALANQTNLSSPVGVAVDSNNNVYISDDGNFVIWEVDSATLHIHRAAGKANVQAFSGDGGAATSAAFYIPGAIAVDGANNVYVLDTDPTLSGNRIREFALGGNINTVAGNGNFTTPVNGPATASIGGAVGMAIDKSNNAIYVSTTNLSITNGGGLAISIVGGTITIIGGNRNGACSPGQVGAFSEYNCWNGATGASTAATLSFPSGIAVSGGNVYYVSLTDARIGEFPASGTGNITLVAGKGPCVSNTCNTGDGGPAVSAGLDEGINGLSVNNGFVYIIDPALIRRFQVGGDINTFAGKAGALPNYAGDGGPATSAKISDTLGKVAFDSHGNMFIADTGNNVIRKVDATTKVISTVAGIAGTPGPPTSGALATNTGFSIANIAIDSSDYIYIAEVNHRVWRFQVGDTIAAVAGTGSQTVDFSSSNGDGGPATSATFVGPSDIAIGSNDQIYVSDAADKRVRVFTVDGNISSAYCPSGCATTSTSIGPFAVGVDPTGNPAYATQDNGIFEFLPAVQDLAGFSFAQSSVTGRPTPGGGGAVYTNGNNQVALTSGGTTTVLAGNGTAGYNGDSIPAITAKLSNPGGVAYDSVCNLYISDTNNQRIRMVPNVIPVTLDSSPASGITLIVDGQNVVTPAQLNWEQGSQHSISAATIQVANGTHYLFVSWSDSGAQTHNVTAPTGCGQSAPYSATFVVPTPPTFSKSFGTQNLTLNSNTNLTFNIGNPNSGIGLSGISFTDNLPSGLVVASPNNSLNSSCSTGTISAVPGSNTISWSNGSLAASGSCSIAVAVTGTQTGIKNNVTGNITATESGNGGTATASTTVGATPPAIAKAFGVSSITQNDSTTLSFAITNPNTSQSLSGVAFNDPLPGGITATSSGATSTCGGTLTVTATSVSLSGGSVAANSSCNISVNVTAIGSGMQFNTTQAITATESGPGTVSNTAPINILPPPVLAISKSHTGNFTQGESADTYTITVTNNGSGPTDGSAVSVTDTLPTGLTATAISGNGWTCSLTTGNLFHPAPKPAVRSNVHSKASKVANAGSGSTAQDIGSGPNCSRTDVLNAGSSYPPITLTVSVASNAPASVTNSATVTGGASVNPNTANDPTTIIQVADLTISKGHMGNFTQGDSGRTYTVTVSNVGAGPTTGTVSVVDTVPTGLIPAGATGIGWSCGISGQAVSCSRSDTLNTSSSYPSISVSVNVATNAAPSVTNTATVSGGGEINTSNDTANDPTTINPGQDLTISKSHVGNFSEGQSGSYTVTVSNIGPSPTNGTVQVVDTVPAGMAPTMANGAGWTCGINLQIVTCSRNDSLGANSSYPIIGVTVSVAPNAPTSLTNTVTVSGGGEINTSNDTANDVTTINQVPVASLSTQNIDFGNIYLTNSTTTIKATLSNVGSVALKLTSIKITPDVGEDQFFTVGNNCTKSLAAGASCMINVSFKPDTNQLGPNSAFVTITDNAAGSPQTIHLTANVIDPQAALSGDVINFGKQKVNTTSAPQTVTLTNEGATMLDITSIIANALNGSPVFAVDSGTTTCTSTLGPGSSCQIGVTFTPAKLGAITGVATIVDNAKKTPQKITLQGIGAAK